jgi:hypothetical protein
MVRCVAAYIVNDEYLSFMAFLPFDCVAGPPTQFPEVAAASLGVGDELVQDDHASSSGLVSAKRILRLMLVVRSIWSRFTLEIRYHQYQPI